MTESQRIAKIHIRKCPESDWIEVLNVPVVALSRFVTEPDVNAVKYLKYLAYCLTGSKGCLSRSGCSGNQQSVQKVSAVPPEQLMGSFYFYPESYRFDLADPDVQARSTSIVSETCFTHSRLRSVAIGDYERCPFTGSGDSDCEVYHLIPRRRGSHYLMNLLNGRGMNICHSDPEISIDDPRNLILLNEYLHHALDKRKVAFITTPNPIFTDASEVGNPVNGTESGGYTLTLHFLREDVLGGVLHQTSCILHHESRPFPVLYPIIYASAAMAAWGVVKNLNNHKAVVEDSDHSDGELKENEDEKETDMKKPSDPNERTRRGAKERDDRTERRQKTKVKGNCTTDDLLDIVLYFWNENAAMAQAQAEESRKRCNDEKVQNWRANMSESL